MPRTRFYLLRVAFEQTLIDRAFDVDPEPEPGFAVDQPDETPQFGRVLDLFTVLEKNCSDDAGEVRELVEDRRIAPRQLFALQVAQYRRAAILGDRRAVLDAVSGQPRPLVVHFEEQEI